METKSLDVAVIGAGIGGLASALALAQRGAQVTVYEQAPVISEVGAGIQISPNGFAVLRALGLGDAVENAAVRADAVVLKNHREHTVLRLDLARYGAGAYHLLHRADLIAILIKAAETAGVTVKTASNVEMISFDEPGLHLKDGTKPKADLIIAADGVHSIARALLNGASEPEFSGQVAWRAVVPNKGSENQIYLYMGAHRHLVSYPLRGGTERNIVAVQERTEWASDSWSQTDRPDRLRQAFADFGPEVRDLLALVEEPNLWGLFLHPVAERWHKGHVALLGDAAHPMLPFLAQGANMALEDAWVLTSYVVAERDLTQALARYQSARNARVGRVVNAARNNAKKYHLSMPPIRWAAHRALQLGGLIAPSIFTRQFDWLYRHDVTQM
ncbi:MAG: FAD-dependent oxidoreductase [Pseudomonadota bacterium]